MDNTLKLIEELKKHSNHSVSDVMINEDGEKYRFHHWKLKYPSASNWLVKLFMKASKEQTGKDYHKNFSYGDISFYYDRPEMKNKPNGTMQMRELEVLSNHDIRFDNGGLIAPNGKPSNLTPKQYKLVRTPAFKDWFGDWENDPANASKVIDENGEPLVVYHGSTEKFYIFDDKKIGQRFKVDEKGFFFTNDKYKANIYAKNGFIYSVFLNIKEPLLEEISTGEPIYYWDSNKDKMLNKIKNNDGIIIDSIISLYEIENNQNPKVIIPFNSNQIKLADGTNKTFDGNNPDIRFDNGGGVDDNTETWRNKYNKKYSYSKNASHNLHEISKDTGVSVKGLQQIYNKGVGAYKTNPSSVRPNVKSKEQWGMGRVYSAVMGGKASKVDAKELKMNKGGKTLSDMEIKKKLAEGGVITQNEILAMKNYIESPNANIKLINTYKKILAKFNVDIDNLNLSRFPKGDYVDTYKFSGYDYMKEQNQEMGVSFLLTGEYELVSKAIYEKDYSMWLFYNYLGRINISFDACKKWLEEAQEHFSYTMPIPIFLVHTPNAKDGRSYAMWYSVSEGGLEQAISKIGRPITWSYNSRYYYQEIGMVGNFDNPKWEGWGSMYKERKTGLLIPEYTETSFHFNTLIHEFAHCLDFQTQLVNNISKYEQRDKTIKEQREYTDIEKELYGNQLIERMETYNQPITNHFDHFVDALIRILRASSSGKIPLTQQYEEQAINVQTSLSGVYGDLLLEQRERKRKLEVQVARDEEVRDNKRFTWQSKWVEDVRDYAQKNAKQEGLKEAISKSNRSRPFYLTEILEFDGLITKYMDDVFRGYMALNPTKAPALLDAIKRMKVETNRLINNHYDNIRNNFIYGMKPTSEMEIGLMNNCDPRQEDNYKKWKDCAKLYIG